MRNKKTAIWIGVVIIVLAAAVYYFYFMPSQTGNIGESVVLEEEEPGESLEPFEEIEPLDVNLSDSDAIVRKLIQKLSSYPALLRWLATDDIIRRFVTATDLIAKGESPRKPLNFIDITGEFPTQELDGKIYIDPDGYGRYSRVAGAIASLDAKGCATLYKQLQLPIQQAYREMGYPEGNFDVTLKMAVSNLLDTPVVDGTVYLEKDVLTYTLADPELEGLNAAQKHFLRIGPENMKIIQAKLREIMRYLDL